MRADLRRKMVWAGLLALPILLVQPVISTLSFFESQSLWLFLFERALTGFSLGAVASALYETLLHKHISPSRHPMRPWLLLLVLGPFLFGVLFFLFGQSFITSLIASLTLDILIVLILRRDLIWDLIVSGAAMGGLYFVTFLLLGPFTAGDYQNLWFTDRVTGITLLGLPVEEILAVTLFGALWGPLYIAIKDLQETGSERFDLSALRPKIFIGRTILTLTTLALLWSANQFLFVPKIVRANKNVPVRLDGPIKIVFNRPIHREDLEVSINPPLPYKLSFENALFKTHLYRTLTLTPETFFTPNQEFTVTLRRVSNVFGVGDKGYEYNFKTLSIPSIAHVSVRDGANDVSPCAPIIVTLNQENSSGVQFAFQTEPTSDLSTEHSPDTMVYFVTPKNCFRQGTTYTLRAVRTVAPEIAAQREEPAVVDERTFVTKRPPSVVSYSPQGQTVLTNTKSLAIEFSEPLLQQEIQQSIRVNPNLSGVWHWEGEKRLVYEMSQALHYDTQYEITIPKGTQATNETILEQDITLSFVTIGRVAVSESSPKPNAVGVSENAIIILTFNQPVDQPSAQGLFSINPSLEGIFSWERNTMSFKPLRPLTRDTRYQITLKQGIKSLQGLDSNQLFMSTFSTQESVTVLNIKLDYQDKALSCEAAALKMALAFKGKPVTENDIMALIGFDPTIRQGQTWGDPDVAFVGNINGRQNSTGYGVHWYPIASAANRLGVNATAFSGWSPSELAKTIAEGHPVIIWGTLGSAYYDPWYTLTGKLIKAWKGEHTRVVIGFKGTVENPTQFILNDPIAGKLTWSTRTLRSNWAAFGNSGVVVY